MRAKRADVGEPLAARAFACGLAVHYQPMMRFTYTLFLFICLLQLPGSDAGPPGNSDTPAKPEPDLSTDNQNTGESNDPKSQKNGGKDTPSDASVREYGPGESSKEVKEANKPVESKNDQKPQTTNGINGNEKTNADNKKSAISTESSINANANKGRGGSTKMDSNSKTTMDNEENKSAKKPAPDPSTDNQNTGESNDPKSQKNGGKDTPSDTSVREYGPGESSKEVKEANKPVESKNDQKSQTTNGINRNEKTNDGNKKSAISTEISINADKGRGGNTKMDSNSKTTMDNEENKSAKNEKNVSETKDENKNVLPEDGGGHSEEKDGVTGEISDNKHQNEDSGAADASSKNVEKTKLKPAGHLQNEAESSHFFVYLVTMALLVAVLYIAYHNKRKIIAYVVEGRRSKTTRRPKSTEYQKLEQNI